MNFIRYLSLAYGASAGALSVGTGALPERSNSAKTQFSFQITDRHTDR